MSSTVAVDFLNFRRDVKNGGFGEAALQRNRTWRMTAEGRVRRFAAAPRRSRHQDGKIDMKSP